MVDHVLGGHGIVADDPDNSTNGTDGTGHDWILNAFRLARQYFPTTKLMLNDVLITNSPEATTEYVKIVQNLKRENLIDAVGVQGHAFVTTPGVSGPTIPGTSFAVAPLALLTTFTQPGG